MRNKNEIYQSYVIYVLKLIRNITAEAYLKINTKLM